MNQTAKENDRQQCSFFDPVRLYVSDQYSFYSPAFVAYEIADRLRNESRRADIAALLTVVLLETPHLSLKVNRLAHLIFVVTEKTGGELFGSAREFVRTKYGQDVLNQLVVKFGEANDGAAAIILQKWGDEG